MISRANGATGRTFKATMLFAWLIALPCVVWGIGKLEFKPGFNLFSLTEDVQVGKEGSAQIDKQVLLLNDAPTLEYVSDLERKLIAFAPNNHAEYVWQIKLVNRPEINAFALPGGYIYVNRGLIETAENEAQLAGALAHESGHVVMRHGTHNASQAMLAQMPLEFLSGMLGQGGSLAGCLMQMGISLGLNSMMLKNSRSAESQADDVGTYMLYEAGYDPRALAQFFQIIERKYPQRTLQFFSDHPNPQNRIREVDRDIARLGPPRGARTDSPEFEATKRRVTALAPPPKTTGTPKVSGRQEPPPPPSEQMTRYEGKVFTLSYPDNWKVEQGESEVAVFPPGGMVTGAEGETAQAYGAAISHYRPQAGNWGLVDATGELVESMRQSNPQLRVVQQTGMNQHGNPAVSTLLQNASPIEGQRETDHLVTMRQGDYVLALIFMAPTGAFESYAPTFDKILESFEVSK